MAEVTVSVTRRGIFQTELGAPRPVRRLPDGCAGVVYRNRVYPLYEGNEIDLADHGFDKDDVLPPDTSGDMPPYSTRASKLVPLVDRWNVESTSLGSYLTFDGTELQANLVVDLLSDIGLPWTRWDRSVRKARDGRRYDWWIRFDREITEDALKRIFKDVNRRSEHEESATEHAPRDESRDVVDDVAGEIEKEVVTLRGLNNKLKDQLDHALAEVRNLSERLEFEHQHAKRERDDAQRIQARLSESIRDRDSQLAQISRSILGRRSPDADVEELKSQIAALKRDQDQLYEQLDDAERRLRSHSDENDSLKRERIDLKERLVDAEDRVDQLKHSQSKLRGTQMISSILDVIFPRLHFDSRSIKELFLFKDVQPIIKLINSLNSNDKQVRIRSVAGHEGVKEVDEHIRTGIPGQANMGRIYLREINEKSGNYPGDVPESMPRGRIAQLGREMYGVFGVAARSPLKIGRPFAPSQRRGQRESAAPFALQG